MRGRRTWVHGEAMVHSDEVEKNAIAYKGHGGRWRRKESQSRRGTAPVLGTLIKMKESGLKLIKFKVAVMCGLSFPENKISHFDSWDQLSMKCLRFKSYHSPAAGTQ